jgi:hypothetical protein
MNNLLNLSFWFDLRPPALIPVFNYIFIGFILFLIILMIVSFKFKNKHKVYKGVLISLYNFSFTNTIIGVILLFFNYQRVPFLAARFWFLFWAILILVWLFFIYKKLKKIPAQREKIVAQEEFNKYLP